MLSCSKEIKDNKLFVYETDRNIKKYTITCCPGSNGLPLFRLKDWSKKLLQKNSRVNKGNYGQVLFDTYDGVSFNELVSFLSSRPPNYDSIKNKAVGRKCALSRRHSLNPEATTTLFPSSSTLNLIDNGIWPTWFESNGKGKGRLYTPLANQGTLNLESRLSCNDFIALRRTLILSINFCANHNIVHLDIKKDNMLNHNGNFFLSDFGSSQTTGSYMNFKIKSNHPSYPPEFYKKRSKVSAAQDLWRAGYLLLEASTVNFDQNFTNAYNALLVSSLEYSTPNWIKRINSLLTDHPYLDNTDIQLIQILLTPCPCERLKEYESFTSKR
jgi:hypothetical protein